MVEDINLLKKKHKATKLRLTTRTIKQFKETIQNIKNGCDISIGGVKINLKVTFFSRNRYDDWKVTLIKCFFVCFICSFAQWKKK